MWEEKLVYSKAYFNECALLCASVGEWLKPSDCKSDALRATKVRIFPGAPLLLKYYYGKN